MKISVIIPCHNAEAYVGEALRSVAEWFSLARGNR